MGAENNAEAVNKNGPIQQDDLYKLVHEGIQENEQTKEAFGCCAACTVGPGRATVNSDCN